MKKIIMCQKSVIILIIGKKLLILIMEEKLNSVYLIDSLRGFSSLYIINKINY